MKKIIIIGGGAAGFFAAINHKIKFPENEVIILEQSPKVLQKVRVSGGGVVMLRITVSFPNS